MKLSKVITLLALAGTFAVTAPSAQATVKFSSKLTLDLTAVVQRDTEDEDLSVTEKLRIANKEALAAFEDLANVTLPDGARMALDEDYYPVIVDKDGDILYYLDEYYDGVQFLDWNFGDSIDDGKSTSKDDGSYKDNYKYWAIVNFYFLYFTEKPKSAELSPLVDYLSSESTANGSWSQSYEASKNDYKYSESDSVSVNGEGVIEGDDAVVTGTVKASYDYKDDDTD
jgi:hypothetical protein